MIFTDSEVYFDCWEMECRESVNTLPKLATPQSELLSEMSAKPKSEGYPSHSIGVEVKDRADGTEEDHRRPFTYQYDLESLSINDSEQHLHSGEITRRQINNNMPALLSAPSELRSVMSVKPKSKGLFPHGAGAGIEDLVDRIKEYRRRQFSHESDILKGFSGALRSFHAQFGIDHCMGVPIVPGCTDQSWSNSRGFVAGMLATTSIHSRRRSGFPSWSWTGWHADDVKSAWPNLASWKYSQDYYAPDLEVQVVFKDGSIIPLDKFVRWDYDLKHGFESNYIKLKASLFPVQIEPYISGDTKYWKLEFEYQNEFFGIPFSDRKYEDEHILLKQEDCLKDLSICSTIAQRRTVCVYPFDLDPNYVQSSPPHPQLWVCIEGAGGWYELFGAENDTSDRLLLSYLLRMRHFPKSWIVLG